MVSNERASQDEVGDSSAQEYGSVQGDGPGREVALSHPPSDERRQRQPKEQVQIRPQDAPISHDGPPGGGDGACFQ